MSYQSPDDELLAILLVNLRNAADTFGEGTPPHESIKAAVENHLKAMNAKGLKTNLTGARQVVGYQEASSVTTPPATTMSFGSLAFRPKPKG